MMESKAKVMGHPIHPMLIVFPLGLLASSLGFDVGYLTTRNRLGVGVDNGAHRNAPNSLSGKPASEEMHRGEMPAHRPSQV